MRSRRRYVTVIYNPAAGMRRRRKLIDVVEAMHRRGAVVTLCETAGPGDALALARRAARAGTADIVVAAGGDGTVNEVANGLAGSRMPLGVIPLGTANVLAIEIGLPRSSRALGELLLTGAARPVGGGSVNGRVFVLWVGAGFDGRLIHAVDPALKRRFGKLAVVWAGLRTIAAGPGAPIAVSDGETRVICHWAVAAKATHYAGRFRLAPSARFEAAGLTTLAVPLRSRFALAMALAALALGRLEGRRGVHVFTAPEIRIASAAAGSAREPVQVDGDDTLSLPVAIACRDADEGPQIRLVMPRRGRQRAATVPSVRVSGRSLAERNPAPGG